MRVVVAVSVTLFWLSGCECRNHGGMTDFTLTANVQVQLADGRIFDNRDPGLESSYQGGGGVVFGTPDPLRGDSRVAFPQDMTVTMPFLTRLTTGESHSVDLTLIVRQVAAGPSQVDLDDTRAALDGWSGLHGHVSITTLTQDCSHGASDCIIELHATIELSATSAGGDTLGISGAMLDRQDTYFDVPAMCAQIGE